MDSAVWGFIGVVVGGLITGLVTLGSEKVRGDKAAALDSAKRQDDRRVAHDEFQRQTLLALQDSIQQVGRATSQSHHYDLMAVRRGEPWGVTLVPDAVSENHLSAHMTSFALMSRVANDELRSVVASALDLSLKATRSTDQATAEAAFNALNDAVDRVLTMSGDLIRQTYGVE